MIISIIVAVAENGAIGKNNRLLWHLPADLKHFKTLTMGHPIIMGRKTFESIGKPLPGRTSIIITRDENYKAEGCIVTQSLEEAIMEARKLTTNEAFIIGGAEIFKQVMPLADKIYLTLVCAKFDGDTFFETPDGQWQLDSETKHFQDDKNPFDYTFSIFSKKIMPIF